MAQPDLIVRARNLYSKLGRYSHGSFRSGVDSWIESAITKQKKKSTTAWFSRRLDYSTGPRS